MLIMFVRRLIGVNLYVLERPLLNMVALVLYPAVAFIQIMAWLDPGAARKSIVEEV